jgi:hypothetical protein
MSTNDPTAAITPARFAAALRDLPLSSVALKAAEIRNSIVHLEYSNLQLKPFAHPRSGEAGDPDCVEAIQENEGVLLRMNERIDLLKAEVERRGVSWREFAGPDEIADLGAKVNGVLPGDVQNGGEEEQVNGTAEQSQERHSAWTDGTFQVGRISGGEVVMDGAGDGAAASTARGPGQGGRLGDEELRRRMEERMRAALEDDDEGMHL